MGDIGAGLKGGEEGGDRKVNKSNVRCVNNDLAEGSMEGSRDTLE